MMSDGLLGMPANTSNQLLIIYVLLLTRNFWEKEMGYPEAEIGSSYEFEGLWPIILKCFLIIQLKTG